MNGLGTVLVTGGAGFIGTALAGAAAAEADRWVVLDNLHPQVHSDGARALDLPEGVELIVGDAAESADWDRVIERVRPDTVVHLAAETGTGQSLDEATRHARTNVVGTTAMLDGFTRHEVAPSRILLAGSRAVYGEGQWRDRDGELTSPGIRGHAQLAAGVWALPGMQPVTSRADRTPPAPTSVYGATKLAQEHILRAWAASRGVASTVLRFQNVYGPGQSLSNSYTGIVALFSRIARQGDAIPLYEDGEVTRDFVFIDDVVAACRASLQLPLEDATVTLDVGSGSSTTIHVLASVIASYYGAPDPVVTGAFRDGDVRYAACDIDQTVARLDWAPGWSLEAGVARLQEWIATR